MCLTARLLIFTARLLLNMLTPMRPFRVLVLSLACRRLVLRQLGAPESSHVRKLGSQLVTKFRSPLKTNVNYLELYAALQAIRRWSPHWANCHVCLHTDNTQAMAFRNKGSCKNPTAMDWLREIFWLSALYNFRLTSRHITGLANVFADRLSRVTEIYTP